jgi:spermidine/putrescine transport system permease protein
MTAALDAGPARRPRRRAPGFLGALPAWVWYVAFFAIPVVFVVRTSFGRKVPLSPGRVEYHHLGFQNYRKALSNPLRQALWQGFQTSLIGTALCLLVAFPIAYYLAVKVPARWKGVMLALLIVPFFTNFLIRTLGWKLILEPKGLISNFLIDHGLRDTKLQLLNTRFAVQLGVVYNYLPLMIFPLCVALERLDPALREASKDLGASRFATFRQITLPLASPGMVAGLLLVFVPLSGDYVTAAILGGAKGNMPGALVASQFFENQDPAQGAAIAVVLILAILLVAGIGFALARLYQFLRERRRFVAIAGVA